MFDTHAHLDDRAFRADLPAVLARAQAAGVTRLITVGTDLPSSRAAVALAERSAGPTDSRHQRIETRDTSAGVQHPLEQPAPPVEIWAAVGVHPHEAKTLGPSEMAKLRELALHPRVVAIGETGLDFYRNLSPREAQLAAFRAHLSLAQELELPVIIHDRDAHAETMRELARIWQSTPSKLRGVLHCFSGDLAMAQEAVSLGFYVSIAGPVTYRNRGPLIDVVCTLPLERLLLETDCPYLPPVPYRGQRNEPAYVTRVAQAIAQIRGLPVENVARVTTDNALHLFGLSE